MMERYAVGKDRLESEGLAFSSKRGKTGFICRLTMGDLYVQWLQGWEDLGHDYYWEYSKQLRQTTLTEGRVTV